MARHHPLGHRVRGALVELEQLAFGSQVGWGGWGLLVERKQGSWVWWRVPGGDEGSQRASRSRAVLCDVMPAATALLHPPCRPPPPPTPTARPHASKTTTHPRDPLPPADMCMCGAVGVPVQGMPGVPIRAGELQRLQAGIQADKPDAVAAAA